MERFDDPLVVIQSLEVTKVVEDSLEEMDLALGFYVADLKMRVLMLMNTAIASLGWSVLTL